MAVHAVRRCRALAVATAALAAAPFVAHAQATSRPCLGGAGEAPGPACLIAHAPMGQLSPGPLYWTIYAFPSSAEAERVRPAHGVVAQAFGRVWLFDVGARDREVVGGQRLAVVGPLPLDTREGAFSAEYLKSTFSPGMSAPVHVHSGPEAFYGVTGSSCLETPDGVQVARGPGHSLTVRRGPPMLLKAIGPETRRGFALILHEEGALPTTLTSAWAPSGLCPAS